MRIDIEPVSDDTSAGKVFITARGDTRYFAGALGWGELLHLLNEAQAAFVVAVVKDALPELVKTRWRELLSAPGMQHAPCETGKPATLRGD